MTIYSSDRDKDGTHRISGGSEPKKDLPFRTPKQPSNIRAYVDFDGTKMTGVKQIPYMGDVADTKLDSIQVIRGGFTLDESEYRFDLKGKLVILSSPIQTTDTYFEIRSQTCNAPTTILNDVLILPVTKHLTKEMLNHFIPNLGDEVSIERIESYQTNVDLTTKIGFANLAEIIDATVKDDGLYATVKFSIQQ